MPILQVVKGLDIGGANGGSEKFGLELSLALRTLEIDVCLCAFYQHGTPTELAWVDQLKKSGIEIIFALDKAQRNPLPGFRRAAEFCKLKKVNLIHSHFQIGSLMAIYIKLIGGIAHIGRTAHITKEWGNGIKAWIARMIFTNCFFPAIFDVEIGVSQSIVKQLDERFLSQLLHKKAVHINNALPDQFIEGAEERVKERWAKEEYRNEFILGSVGRLTPRKGYRFLLMAMNELGDAIPNIRLKLVGDGEERSKLTELTHRLGLSGKVEFLGQRNDVSALLSQMDLLILPSLEEGLPTVVLESMAYGTPVLATDIPGTRELIKSGETGWLIPPANPNALATGIKEAYALNDLRRNICLRAAADLTRFRFETIASEYKFLYSKLIH